MGIFPWRFVTARCGDYDGFGNMLSATSVHLQDQSVAELKGPPSMVGTILVTAEEP
jgi:hypothetical protein